VGQCSCDEAALGFPACGDALLARRCFFLPPASLYRSRAAKTSHGIACAPPPKQTPPTTNTHTCTQHQAAERVEGEEVVLRLDAPSPQAAAAARDEARAAALNRQLGDRIRAAAAWSDLCAVLWRHGDDLNYVNVALIAARAGELCPGAAEPPRPGQTGIQDPTSTPAASSSSSSSSAAAAASGRPPPPPELERIGALALERASWFQGAHFAATAWGLARAGLTARGFWRGFAGACERKVPSLSFAQLGMVLCAVASSE